LPKGPVLEGQLCLTPSKMRKSFALLDTELFVSSLRETVAELAYFNGQGDSKNSLDIENVTYGSYPVPTVEKQAGISSLTEQFVLCFFLNCFFKEIVVDLDWLVVALEGGQGFKVRKEFLNSLQGRGSAIDHITSVAALLAIHRRALDKSGVLLPMQIFELAFKALQIAGQTTNIRVMAKPAFEWLSAKWTFISDHQRFLLTHPALHEKSINQALTSEGNSWIIKLVDLLQAILPTLGLSNESELNHVLNDIRKANC